MHFLITVEQADSDELQAILFVSSSLLVIFFGRLGTTLGILFWLQETLSEVLEGLRADLGTVIPLSGRGRGELSFPMRGPATCLGRLASPCL